MLFAAANNMIIMSTQFQHKQIHKGNWRSPDYNIINETVHVLVNQNKTRAHNNHNKDVVLIYLNSL